MSPSPGFPAIKSKKMRKLLRELGYRAVPGRGKGSHTVLEAEGRPQIVYAFHDKEEIGPVMVRKILVKQVGLTIDEAKELMERA